MTATNNLLADTICAVSTPPGVGGIAVVRLSGPQAVAVALRCLPSLSQLRDHHAVLADCVVQGNFLDQVVVTYYQSPHSYTGEEVVELDCHGSLYVQQALLTALLASGARMAEPGEFTRRAFLNGRMDLSQAEAVADLIDATNAASHHLAVSQLRGGYSKELALLRDKFVELTSLMELELDFSDEEVEFADRSQLGELLSLLETKVAGLCDSFRLGNAMKNGVPVAIAGRPNVGKSTLLNALLRDDRAIVSDIPGTTRDTVEESINIEGIAFRFVDTAGLRHSDEQIEAAGIARSYRAIREAQIVLYMVDAAQSPEAVVQEIDEWMGAVAMEGRQLMLLRNKADRQVCPSATWVEKQGRLPAVQMLLSAKQGTGLDDLRQRLVQTVRQGLSADDVLVANVRHYEALRHVQKSLLHVRDGLDLGISTDLVLIDLRDALYYLGQITGQVTADEVLGTIFSRFCVGK